MADIEISGSNLVVHIRGLDQVWSMAAKLEVPLVHVAGVDVDVPDARDAWHGWRMGGTNLPGVITAGRFVQHYRRPAYKHIRLNPHLLHRFYRMLGRLGF